MAFVPGSQWAAQASPAPAEGDPTAAGSSQAAPSGQPPPKAKAKPSPLPPRADNEPEVEEVEELPASLQWLGGGAGGPGPSA